MRSIAALAAVSLLAAAAVFTGNSRAGLPPREVQYIPASAVNAAFAKGMPLLEQFNYKIHASRREAPGLVEIHAKDTDIIHVLGGSAILVTGGAVREANTIAPDEIRGQSVDGGTEYQLAGGDVMVVPAGTPHWFKSVQGPFLYYVVKVN